ncbi:hypothetical protein AHAS_Ahas03G0186800 [Arachis hypogaea]
MRLEVKESEYYSKESVRTLDPVQGLHVDGEGSDVREEGSEGFKGHEGFEAESEIHDEFGDGFYDNWEEKAINKIVDLDCMNPKKITVEVIKSVHLSDREIAFLFYNLYTKMNGFAAQRELCVLAFAPVDDFVDVIAKLRNEILHLKGKRLSPSGEGADPLVSSTLEDCIRDPQIDEVDWLRSHWSGHDASEKHEDESCEEDHYLNVSLSEP